MQTLDESAKKFAVFIRLKREKRKMSVQVLADKAKLSKAFVYLIQDKLNQPSISSATRILSALDETWETFSKFLLDEEC